MVFFFFLVASPMSLVNDREQKDCGHPTHQHADHALSGPSNQHKLFDGRTSIARIKTSQTAEPRNRRADHDGSKKPVIAPAHKRSSSHARTIPLRVDSRIIAASGGMVKRGCRLPQARDE